MDRIAKTAMLAAGLLIAGMLISSMLFSSQRFVKVAAGNATFTAEIAQSVLQRMQGLMFRKQLEQGAGMLFVFPNDGPHGFWMMNTSIPLDIIWISGNKRVVHIEKEAQPCLLACKVYQPKEDARYVLEINAGLADRYGIKVNGTVAFRWPGK